MGRKRRHKKPSCVHPPLKRVITASREVSDAKMEQVETCGNCQWWSLKTVNGVGSKNSRWQAPGYNLPYWVGKGGQG